VKYIPLFVLIQLVNLPLMAAGWFVCLLPVGLVPPPWRNPDVMLSWTYWQRYTYEAWRNPVSGLRNVPGVSGKGRPLWRKTWGARPGGWYVQAGWESSYPVLSGGRNVNTW
jgi:hypothetical protein